MNHILTATLLMAAAVLFPILWVAIGLPYRDRRDWWD